jgi:hypothetical protein
MDYKKDMRIDETSLDVEWLEQAELAARYGAYFVDCKDEVMRAEENIKVIRAELVALANEDPDKHLGEGVKPTAPNVESFYRTHKKHKEAKERWLKALKELSMAEIVKNEISFTRKAALEALVQLHGQNYFAGPKMPRDIHKERQNRDSSRTEMNTKVRRMRRSG